MGPAGTDPRADVDRVAAPEVQRFLTLWWFSGIAAAALVLLSFEVALTPEVVAMTAGLAGLVGLGHLAAVRFPFGRTGECANLVEAGVVLALLFLAPIPAFVAGTVGVMLADGLRRVPGSKIAFNTASNAVAMGLAIGLIELVGAPEVGSPLRLLSVGLAALVYGSVNILAVTRIITLLERTSMAAKLRSSWPFVVSSLISTGLGILAAIAWGHDPVLVTLLAVPVAATVAGYHRLSVHRRQHALTRRELERVGRVLGATVDGIALLDERGRVEVWNGAVERLTGRAGGRALGHPVEEVLHLRGIGGDRVDLAAIVQTFATDPAPWAGELMLDRSRGEPVPVAVTVSVSDGGEVGRPGAVVVLSDLSQQRAADRAKDDFLMRITHELRTPLTPIKGYAETLRANPDRVTPELLDHALERISDRADQMTALIDDLLLVAAATHEQHQRQAGRRPVDVVDRVRLVADLIARREARQIEVRGAVAALCLTDPMRLDRIITVLLDNASTYSAAGTPVTVDVRATDSAVEVAVSDQGRGIPADHLDAIFDRFHRVEDPLVMTTGGLGIGLYLARRFATSMDGSLEVDSELGVGSTFTLRLPSFRVADRAARSSSVT